MIKNERQLKISRSHVVELREAIESLEATPIDPSLHPRLRDLEFAALKSQLDDIEEEVAAYMCLVESPPSKIVVESLHDLPTALIQARIAAGLTHRQMAERLGLREQAIQRYEATDYTQANIGRLMEVADALGVQVRQEVHLFADLSTKKVLKRLNDAGIDPRLIKRRMLPASYSEDSASANATSRLVSDIERIFGWSARDLRSGARLELDMTPELAASFKKPVNAPDRTVRAYVVYAHYIALQVASLVDEPLRPPPREWEQLREELNSYGELTFRNVLSYTWDRGIAVVPLQDHVAMHGAYWHFGDRAAIVMKQGMRTCSRWLFDLLHELYHAATEEEGIVDTPDDQISESEDAANEFAANVLIGGRAEELFQAVVTDARHEMQFLKQSAQRVAGRAGIPIGIFANALAWRLAPGHNWWGAASNLQKGEADPWEIARDVLLEKISLEALPMPDQRLVMAALQEEGNNIHV